MLEEVKNNIVAFSPASDDARDQLHEIIRRYRSIVRYDSPGSESAASEALHHPLSQRLRLPK